MVIISLSCGEKRIKQDDGRRVPGPLWSAVQAWSISSENLRAGVSVKGHYSAGLVSQSVEAMLTGTQPLTHPATSLGLFNDMSPESTTLLFWIFWKEAQSTAQSKCFPDGPEWVRGPFLVSDTLLVACVCRGYATQPLCALVLIIHLWLLRGLNVFRGIQNKA